MESEKKIEVKLFPFILEKRLNKNKEKSKSSQILIFNYHQTLLG